MQRYELDAWLGDDHDLDEDQVRHLLAAANDIEVRYPDPDDADDREVALTVAYRLMVEDAEDVVVELGADLSRARVAGVRAMAGLQQAANAVIVPDAVHGDGVRSVSGFAKLAGVDRMTVLRRWLKRG